MTKKRNETKKGTGKKDMWERDKFIISINQ
jgi:hypothetical protein